MQKEKRKEPLAVLFLHLLEASETGVGIEDREAARRSPADVAVSSCLLNMAMPICCKAPVSDIIPEETGVIFMTIPPSYAIDHVYLWNILSYLIVV